MASNEIGGLLNVIIRPVPGEQRFRIEFYHPNSVEIRDTSMVNYNPNEKLFPATRMSIGQELAGNIGAFGPEATWIYNQWLDSAGTFRFQGFNQPPAPCLCDCQRPTLRVVRSTPVPWSLDYRWGLARAVLLKGV